MANVKYRIRELRMARKLKQCELARKLGIQAHNISNWERGVYKPSNEHLAALCVALDCQIRDLLVLEPIP